MTTQIPNEFPFAVIALSYAAVAILAIILILLFRISGQLSVVSRRLKSSPRSETRSTPVPTSVEPSYDQETASSSGEVEVGPGTPFEEFLNEDPENRRLSKKEQFKAYRKWRAAKGLNWSK